MLKPVAALAACLMALSAAPLRAAPGDITAIPAPVIGADPPKAKEIKEGDVSVSTQTGSLSYAYPITVPPGRLGMQPSLALSYSSQAPIYGGIAAGWSLSIPEIRRDTSTSWLLQSSNVLDDPEGTRQRFVSSLAGDRPLVVVNEPGDQATDVLREYRAQNDSSFDRYERLQSGAAYHWRVRSHGGVTHYFGDTSLTPANDRWSPLMRTVDAYGNTVEYQWSGTRIAQIRYTSNTLVVPARPDFARVDFEWSPAPVCAAGTAVGQVDDRRLKIIRGGSRLDRIRITAYEPGAPNAPLHTREIALGYDAAAALCTARHGPILQLRTIQESAAGDTEPSVTLPPVTFSYNRLERAFDQPVNHGIVWPPEARGNLGWGTRDGEWPTVESMFLDFDGDGLQDRLLMADRAQCTFAWMRNLGASTSGAITFAPPSAPIALPRLPWKNNNATPASNEWCSLSGQYTEYVNTTVLPDCSQANTFLAYRWLDSDGDGLPDLVTAIHSRGEFDPNQEPFFGAWPACEPAESAACLVPEASCFAQVTTCPYGQTFGTCTFDRAQLAACLPTMPKASCDVIVGWASQTPTSACVDNCFVERQCAASGAGCLGECQRQCSAGALYRQPFGNIDPSCATWSPPDGRPDKTACLSLAVSPPTPPQGCPTTTLPQRRCGRYPWMIYDNTGGHLDPAARTLYQPVPLESDSGDSAYGGAAGMAATNHGVFDLDGRWGFRGFEEVTTTLPSLARQVDTYGFNVDWSGRLKASKKFASEDPTSPRTVSETEWSQKTLFGGAIKTFHPTAEHAWTCASGQSELTCKSSTGNRVTKASEWTALGGQLWVSTGQVTRDSDAYDAGDRRTIASYHLESGPTTYRVQQEAHHALVATATAPLAEAYTNYQTFAYDPAWRHVVTQRQYLGAGSVPDLLTPAETTFGHDELGLKRTELRPLQQPSDPVLPNGLTRQTDYDATGRFATSLTNEVGHVVTAGYEPGTGAEIWSEGPHRTGSNAETTWTDVDGLGRPIASHVNRDTGAVAWIKTLISRTTHVDQIVGGARPNVTVENLIDYEGAERWTREETRLDSRHRPVEVRVKTGAASPDAVTTYNYDHRGAMVSVTVPDPSAAPGTAGSVAYTYGYDSLGRPTSMVRPAINGAASGVLMTYDGLTTTSDEVAGGEGGPVARKVLVNDAYGRLTEVREYTSLAAPETYAPTHYQYDAHDRVSRIESADAVVTVLTHDYVGRRVQIDRAGRTWKYGYDHHGNLTSEQVPPPDPLLASQYTTTSHYDAIDRLSSRDVGGRELSEPDRTLFGIGTVAYAYDTCTHGTGRLCSATMPNGRLTTTHAYDAEGNPVETSRQYDVGGVADTRVTKATFGPGGRVVEQTYPDHATGHPDDTTRSRIDYDDRALPATLSWLPATAPTWTPARVLAAQTRNGAGLVRARSANLAGLGTGGPWRNFTSTWTYDKLSRVASQTVRDQFDNVHATQALTYHGLDDPRTLHHQLGATSYDFTYAYDPRHQLTSVIETQARFTASYGFTAGGKLANTSVNAAAAPGGSVTNRNVTYRYTSAVDPEAPTALEPAGGGANLRSYAYDSVGNLQHRIAGNPGGAATDTFVYDGDDQLRRSTIWAGTNPQGVEEYYYGHGGDRFAVVTRDAQQAVTAVRLFLDGTEVEVEPATGSVVTAFAYLSMGTPVAKVVSPAGGWVAGTSYPPPYNLAASLELQYHGLANNTLLSIRPNAVVQAAYIYGPYGEVIESAGSTAGLTAQRRRFNDKVQDDQTGLHYYGVRYYDDLMLAWTQADPLFRFAPDAAWSGPRYANLYQFVLSNPLRYVDPDGRMPLVIVPVAVRVAPVVVRVGPLLARAAPVVAKVAATAVAAAATALVGNAMAQGKARQAAWAAVISGGTVAAMAASKAPTDAKTRDQAVPDTLAPPMPRGPECDPGEGGATSGAPTAPPMPTAGQARQKGDRMTEATDLEGAIDQLDGLERKQDEARRRGSGDATVQETKKSKDNVRNRLRRIKCADDVE